MGAGAPIGNKNAAKSKLIHDLLRKASIQEDHKRLKQGIELALNMAAEGDLAYLTFVRDTLDGKPAQALAVSDPDGNPFTVMLKKEEASL